MSEKQRKIIQIRPLGPEDFELFWSVRLLALQESPQAFGASYEESKKMAPEEAIRRLKPRDGGFVLGAFVQSASADGAFSPTLVGLAGFVRHDFLKGKHKGMIWGVYVVPEFRGQGVARAVVNTAIEKCRTIEGLEEITLTVSATNEPACNLYKSLGFETYGVEPRALKIDGEYIDEALMVLRLHAIKD